MQKALTNVGIKNAKPKVNKSGKLVVNEVPDGALRGLYLLAYPSGAKSFAVRYRRKSDGKSRKIVLGPVALAANSTPRENVALGEPLSLAEAHKLAGEQLHRVALALDPAAERQNEKKAAKETAGRDRDLFANVVTVFLRRHARHHRTVAETTRLFEREVLPHWSERRIQEITKRDVIALLDNIMDSERGTTANRVLAAVRRLFNWCIERDILQFSPCANVKRPYREVTRSRTLDDDELAIVWQAADGQGFPFGDITKLLILTGCRRDEVGKLCWSEINRDKAEIGLEGDRTKNGEPHTIPLSPTALEVLGDIGRIKGCPFVFSTTGRNAISGWSRSKKNLDAKIADLNGGEPLAGWRTHDLRRSVATGMQRLGVGLQTIEAVLGHVSGSRSGVVGIYQRHSFHAEKRTALEAWARHVEKLVDGEAARTVVQFPGA